MDQLEDKMNAILGNPQLMQQIMSMAQSLGNPAPETPPKPQPAPQIPNLDPAILGKIAGLAGQSGIDGNQQALLTALHPYLSVQKVHRLERAMRAAKMARLASGFLGQGGLSALIGR